VLYVRWGKWLVGPGTVWWIFRFGYVSIEVAWHRGGVRPSSGYGNRCYVIAVLWFLCQFYVLYDFVPFVFVTLSECELLFPIFITQRYSIVGNDYITNEISLYTIYCIVSSGTPFETWWWPSDRAETCSLYFPINTTPRYVVVFDYTYPYIIYLTQLGCYNLRSLECMSCWRIFVGLIKCYIIVTGFNETCNIIFLKSNV